MNANDSHLRPGQKVLIFDSGMGGLSVRRALERLAPDLVIDYGADTRFFPYGDKPDEALAARVPAAAKAMVEVSKPDALVIACNTASTLALDATRAVLDIPVIGTVPAIKPAAAMSQKKTIGLLATPGTLARPYTARLIADFASTCRVIQHGSVELVHLAEHVAAGEAVPLDKIAAAQAPLFEADTSKSLDTVVLACTHFPLLRDQLVRTAPAGVTYIDSGDAIARQAIRVLESLPAGPDRDRDTRAWITTQSASPRLTAALGRYGLNEVCTAAVAIGDAAP
ncbi:MAG: glutamate racemase [Pseudomonadota bacterium]